MVPTQIPMDHWHFRWLLVMVVSFHQKINLYLLSFHVKILPNNISIREVNLLKSVFNIPSAKKTPPVAIPLECTIQRPNQCIKKVLESPIYVPWRRPNYLCNDWLQRSHKYHVRTPSPLPWTQVNVILGNLVHHSSWLQFQKNLWGNLLPRKIWDLCTIPTVNKIMNDLAIYSELT